MSEHYGKKGPARTHAKKDSKSQYDPQVGQAAKMNAQIAQQAMQFSQQYFTQYVAPALTQMTEASEQTQNRLNTMFDFNFEQMQEAQERYEQYGVPAENRYFEMVDKFSEPEEMERQATAALGDVRVAANNQTQTQMRQMQSLGIDPTSPAAVAASSSRALMGTAQEAGAMNRARNAARQMGMALTADAANFGRGGQSGILNFGNAASGNTTGAFGVSSGALGGANSSAGVPMQGYGLGLQGYTANLNAYTSLAQADMAAQAQSDAGLGNFLGSVGAAAMQYIPFSDIRLKQDIRLLGYLPNHLPVYAFRYKPEADLGDDIHYGFMAQDVKPLIPDAVIADPSGYMRVDYRKVLEF